MARTMRKELVLAQNFLEDARLVRTLVGSCAIGREDTVYDIGAGKGIITAELARVARRVIALEIDPALVSVLRQRFRDSSRVEIREADFLQYRVLDRDYMIFANIPYNQTADIVRKILSAFPAPRDAYLVMQKEAARKFSGCPRETRFSLLEKPWFRIRIVRALRRTDFHPAPRVDSVLLQIEKRDPPLVHDEDAGLYKSFIRYGFRVWKSNLKLVFQNVFSFQQWRRLSADLGFPMRAVPTELTFEQWLGLFACLKERVPRGKQKCLQG
jgi:16S rRNA A1518/A1519 N6-dimethyltransferase RsmA/KsgA/DIM1 with predicted DNA glycosylase/AP lyase activity